MTNGPRCDTCGESHWYNFFVPDDVWERIAPLDIPGGGALCVRCIDKRCVELGIKTLGRFHFVGEGVSDQRNDAREYGVEEAREAFNRIVGFAADRVTSDERARFGWDKDLVYAALTNQPAVTEERGVTWQFHHDAYEAWRRIVKHSAAHASEFDAEYFGDDAVLVDSFFDANDPRATPASPEGVESEEGLRAGEPDWQPGRIQELESVFGHIHEAGDPNLDTCAKCGLDIRDQIHTRGVAWMKTPQPNPKT